MNRNEKLFFKINGLVGKNRWLDAFGRAGAEWVIFAMGAWYISISLIVKFGNEIAMWTPIFALGLAGVLGWVLHHIIGRIVQQVRPRMKFPEIKLLFWPLSKKSFPSDHALLAFLIFYFALIFNLPTAWSLLPLALWVVWGRVYSGVHYPLDILGGFVSASIISLIFYFINVL